LFQPIQLREISVRNRIFVSPMCMYCSQDGMPTDWHLVHLGSRAVGGAGMVIVEATAVSPEGRITPDDSGIWSDEHARAFSRITRFIKEAGAVPAIQLAHAGRKASTDAPWRGGRPLSSSQRGWQPIAPSAIPFDAGYPTPTAMSAADVDTIVHHFVAAAHRALAAGFDCVELHMAHGYLLHEFLSPLSNQRTDDYGGSLANRMRLPLRIAQAVRQAWPARLPLLARLSVTDWTEGGWDLPQSIELSKSLKSIGVDMIDCSSGALVPRAQMPIGPGYQVPFARAIRRDAAIPTGAVGMITTPEQAEQILADGNADVILLARQLLRDPYWPLHAAAALGEKPAWPRQYERAG
jgi:2,4-dienoyl-CoA reductase-like NADH-dependent reductase (Old Yellow Enzyme family)